MKREDIPEKYRRENVRGLRFFVEDKYIRPSCTLKEFLEVIESLKNSTQVDDINYDDPNTFKTHDTITYNQ